MKITPVLVPDHDAAGLRALMDSFATASTGPTRQELTESRSAVAAAQGVSEGKRADRYHIVKKDGKPANLASYADRASAVKDRDEKYPGATVQKVGPRGKVKDVTEGSDDSGAYDKWDPKHPDFVKNYKKFQARNPGATLKDFIADLKKGIAEGQGMSRAAKGYEKYGREGMAALARAGREGRDLDPVRQRYDKYDEAVAEAGRPDVMRHAGDTTVKIVKRRGVPIGEIGTDAEASEGNGPYYVKLYDGSYDAVGFDTAAEALAELKYAIRSSVTEVLGTSPDKLLARTGMNLPHKFPRTGQTNLGNIPGTNLPDSSEQTKKHGQERRANRPDNLKAAIRDQLGKHTRPNLPESSVTEDDVDDFVAGGGKITQVKPNPGPRRSGVSLGSRHIGTVRGGKASSISGKRANTHSTVKPVVAVEQQVAEKSEAVRHANNPHDYHSRYPVDESRDPIEQLRADIRRFAQ